MNTMEPARRRGALSIALFAALLGIVHLGAAYARHESRLAATRADEAYAAVQAKQMRETVLIAFGNSPGLDKDVRGAELGEALRLRHGSEGIGVLQQRARDWRGQSEALATVGTEYEIAEAGLQLAILLLAVALAGGQRRLATAACVLAGLSVAVALVAAADQLLG